MLYGGDPRIYENSIFPAYVPEKKNNPVQQLLNSNKIIDYIFGIMVERRFRTSLNTFYDSGVGSFWEDLKKKASCHKLKIDTPRKIIVC